MTASPCCAGEALPLDRCVEYRRLASGAGPGQSCDWVVAACISACFKLAYEARDCPRRAKAAGPFPDRPPRVMILKEIARPGMLCTSLGGRDDLDCRIGSNLCTPKRSRAGVGLSSRGPFLPVQTSPFRSAPFLPRQSPPHRSSPFRASPFLPYQSTLDLAHPRLSFAAKPFPN